MKSRAFDKSRFTDWIDPKEVKPYKNNPKLHPPEQIRKIAASIRRFGWQQDTVITADNVLVIGHGRRLAAMEIGCEMPFHRVGKNADELSDEEIRALRLADNQTALSGWDMGAVRESLDEIIDIDMGDFGFFTGNSGYEEPAHDTIDNGAPQQPGEVMRPYGQPEGQPYYVPDDVEQEDDFDGISDSRRVIITYDPDREPELKRLLGITSERVLPVYSFDELKGA